MKNNLAILLILWGALFAIRFSGPPDWLLNDQERPAEYVADVVQNGHWASQRDISNEVMSKPPLSVWLSAALALARGGRVDAWTMYLPTGLAVLGAALLVLMAGNRFSSPGVGCISAIFYLFSFTSFRQLALARTDPVFTCVTFGAALLGFFAWRTGRGWIWFWVAACAANLTKGPLGLLFPLGGFLACIWNAYDNRRAGRGAWHTPPSGGHVFLAHTAGVLVFIAVTGLWLRAALKQDGADFIAKVVGHEMVRQAVNSVDTPSKFYSPLLPALYFLSRFAPWSLLACLGIWRAARHPSVNPEERNLERFLACYLLAGLAILGMISHKRGDLNFPLLPAAALLAGREFSLFAQGRNLWGTITRPAVSIGVSLLAFALFFLYGHHLSKNDYRVERTLQYREAARELTRRVGADFPLTHVDVPYTAQFYLGTLRPLVSAARAAELLKGPDAAFVTVKDIPAFEKAWNAIQGGKPNLQVVFRVPGGTGMESLPNAPNTPGAREGTSSPRKPNGKKPDAASKSGTSAMVVYSNREKLDWFEEMAFINDNALVRLKGARLLRATRDALTIAPQSSAASISLKNEDSRPREWSITARDKSFRVQLPPGGEKTLHPAEVPEPLAAHVKD